MTTEGTLNLEQKLSILSQISNGFKTTDLAKEYDVDLCDIVETENERAAIAELVCSSYFQAAEEMPYRHSLNPRMENILYKWYMTEARERSVINKNIRGKALELNRIVSENARPFKASSKWCVAFKNRFSINTNDNNDNNENTQPEDENDVEAAAVVQAESGFGADISQGFQSKTVTTICMYLSMK